MKHFTRVEPTMPQEFGDRFKFRAVVKHFTTDDGLAHEFTTIGGENEHAGAVIALTTDNQVVTSYQFRGGPERWLYEIPGGEFNGGEDFELAARRELQEETGYEPGEIMYLGDSSRGAYMNTMWHYYIATNCQLSADGSGHDETEHAQGLEVRLISITELINNAKSNQMSDPHAVLMAYEMLKKLEGKDETTD